MRAYASRSPSSRSPSVVAFHSWIQRSTTSSRLIHTASAQRNADTCAATAATPNNTKRMFCPSQAHIGSTTSWRSEEHTSELQSLRHLVCRLLLEKKKNKNP